MPKAISTVCLRCLKSAATRLSRSATPLAIQPTNCRKSIRQHPIGSPCGRAAEEKALLGRRHQIISKRRMPTHRRNEMIRSWNIAVFTVIVLTTIASAVRADDGYRLWMRYDALPETSAAAYRTRIRSIAVPGRSATLDAIRDELTIG